MTRYLYNLGLLLLMFVSGAETRGIPVQVKAGDLKTERYSRLLL